ncbi:MAG: NAD(P)H-hydrate dehydratase [Actinomycetota bacterium]|nr:NAD(P)H-hydrate dehydratase [Actinomycetota bacterium]
MRPLLTPDEMRRGDESAISSGTPASVLMERAGRAVAREAIRLAGGRYGRRALVLCGKGKNGGDGLVAARVLEAEGLSVEVVRLFEGDEVRSTGGFDVVVDAIFGTGFKGEPEGPARDVIERLQGHPGVVAADIPSGVDGATGAVAGVAVEAAVTVAMGAEKLGTALSPGAAHAGRVVVADIGIPIPPVTVRMIEDDDVRGTLPRRAPDAHKRSAGSVAVLAGSEETRGAALLTCRGAGRMGAGYVTLGSTRSVTAAATVAAPELLTRAAGEGNVLGPEALDRLGPALDRAGALAIGPGIGVGDAQSALCERALREVGAPIVLDADALNVLAETPGALVARSSPAVLTPHPAELARLLGVDTPEVTGDRLGGARRAAERFGCIVVAKGHRTIVTDGSTSLVVPTGGPDLATAGTGDVLTGAVAALLAAGLDPFDAAWCAAYVHGVAGEMAGRGALAWDVAEALGKARSRFTLTS